MKNKTISTIILATTLSFAGVSYASGGNQQGMNNNQNCANQSGEMKDNQNCAKQSGEMKNKHHGKNKSASMEKGNHKGKNHAHKQGKHHQKMDFAKLDLSAEQKQKIDAIMDNVKTENQKSKLAHRASMQALMANETFDEDAAKALMSHQQTQKAEKRLSMMKAKHDAFQVLTDDQKAKYSELKMERKGR